MNLSPGVNARFTAQGVHADDRLATNGGGDLVLGQFLAAGVEHAGRPRRAATPEGQPGANGGEGRDDKIAGS